MGTNRHVRRVEATAPAAEAQPANLAQIAADAVRTAGVSIAAFARANEVPYLALMRLVAAGVPPTDAGEIAALAKALRLPAERFQAALDRSRSSPMPAAEAAEGVPVNPLQARLLQVVEERSLTMKAFAEQADLSVLTATRILRRGELPGRTTTHEKLKHLLGLDQAAYERLLEESRTALERIRPHGGPHAALEASAPQPPPRVAEAGNGVPSIAEIMELVEQLTPKQRTALKQFLLSMI